VTSVSVADLRSIELPRHARDNGAVVVAEMPAVPFAIARMFTLHAPAGAERGKHAHRRCSQFMLCVNGTIKIICDDGQEQRTVLLDRSNVALLVPPTIWNTVVFCKEHSVLVVLCDRPYEAEDYIHDSDEFRKLRGLTPS